MVAIKAEAAEMKAQLFEKSSALMTAAFGLIAALAWNDAIKSLFVGPCGTTGAGALCMFTEWGPWAYAIVITVIAVVATIWISKLAAKAQKK